MVMWRVGEDDTKGRARPLPTHRVDERDGEWPTTTSVSKKIVPLLSLA